MIAVLLGGCATVASYRTPSGAERTVPPGATGNAPAAAMDSRHLLVSSARAMLGQPYRFGGSAPGGFDCSGLVRYAAAAARIAVPRTAHRQLETGVAIPRDELQPGDLVFMHLQHKELHVGIALDRTRFIHAPSTGGVVRIDSLAAPPYAQGFLGARRIVLALEP